MSSHRRPCTTGENQKRLSLAKQPPPPTAALRLLNETNSRDLPRIDLMNLLNSVGNGNDFKSANSAPCYATCSGGSSKYSHPSRLDRLSTLPRENNRNRGVSSSSNNNSEGRNPPQVQDETRMLNKLFPDCERSVSAALREAELAVPFEHATESYHTSQHSALNAELRRAAETKLEAWIEQMNDGHEMLQRYTAESSAVNSAELSALKAYFKSYCCPEDQKVKPETLIARMGLSVTMGEIAQIQDVSAVPLDQIRRALDNLLNADYSLATLDEYRETLSVLDRILGTNNIEDNTVDGDRVKQYIAQEGEDNDRAAARRLTSAASDDTGESTRHGDSSTASSLRARTAHSGYSTGRNARALQTHDTPNEQNNRASNMGQPFQSGQSIRLLPSNTSVILHERMHHQPCQQLLKEMKKNESSLSAMEQRAEEAKKRKECAMDAQDPIEALRNLHAQVDFSNNMLLINKQRMHLVHLHRDEIYALRDHITQCIDDANHVSDKLDSRVMSLLPRVTHDTQAVAEGIESSLTQLRELKAVEQEAEQTMRVNLREMETAERALWGQIGELMNQLRESARSKLILAQQHMALREQRAKEWSAAQELLQSRERHADLLAQCESVLLRWQAGQEIHEKYVQAFAPKLLKRLQALEDGDEDLHNREAQSYVRRYEVFAYAAEEARAKRCVQIDRMRMLQRALEQDSERAVESLDPAPELYTQRCQEAAKEAEEVSAYVKFIADMEQARREEVEPVLHRVMAYNQAMQAQAKYESEHATERLNARAGEPNEKMKRLFAQTAPAAITNESNTNNLDDAHNKKSNESRSRKNYRSVHQAESCKRQESDTRKQLTPVDSDEDQGGQTPSSSVSSNHSATRAAQIGGDEEEHQTPVLMATVAHPFVTARQIGLAHNTHYLNKHNRFNETELAAVEDKMVKIRQQRTNLDDMAVRYQNADYIRQLLQNAGEPNAVAGKF